MDSVAQPHPVADVLPEVGRPTVEGVTIGRTACCDTQVQHAFVRIPGSVVCLWFDGEGKQVSACACGHELPDAGRWRP